MTIYVRKLYKWLKLFFAHIIENFSAKNRAWLRRKLTKFVTAMDEDERISRDGSGQLDNDNMVKEEENCENLQDKQNIEEKEEKEENSSLNNSSGEMKVAQATDVHKCLYLPVVTFPVTNVSLLVLKTSQKTKQYTTEHKLTAVMTTMELLPAFLI